MKKFAYQATQRLYALIVGIIFLLILFGQWCSFKLKKGFLIPNIVILGGIILAGAFVYYWRYKRNGKQKAERIWKYDLIVRISLIILFVVQIFIAYNIVFEPGWDAGGIYNSAKIFVNGNRADIVIRYPFSMYPNNLLLLFIESAVISFCNLFANENEVVQLMFFAVLNSMINVAACYLTYKSANLICKKKIAFAFKMQTIFIFPFIICFYIYKKQFSIFELLITVFTFWISGIGAFVQGRSLLDPFRIYANQTGTYQYMHVNFPSFWMFVGNDYEWLKTAAIVMAAGICGMGLYIIMKRKLDCSRPENFVSIASWFIWTCVLFLPAMHERYAYPLEILLVILTCINKDYLKYSSVAILFSLFTYGNYLFSNGGLDKYIVIIYAGCYLHFTYTILKKNSKAATVTDKEMQNE